MPETSVVQWAVAAEASSTYAPPFAPGARPLLPPLVVDGQRIEAPACRTLLWKAKLTAAWYFRSAGLAQTPQSSRRMARRCRSGCTLLNSGAPFPGRDGVRYHSTPCSSRSVSVSSR